MDTHAHLETKISAGRTRETETGRSPPVVVKHDGGIIPYNKRILSDQFFEVVSSTAHIQEDKS